MQTSLCKLEIASYYRKSTGDVFSYRWIQELSNVARSCFHLPASLLCWFYNLPQEQDKYSSSSSHAIGSVLIWKGALAYLSAATDTWFLCFVVFTLFGSQAYSHACFWTDQWTRVWDTLIDLYPVYVLWFADKFHVPPWLCPVKHCFCVCLWEGFRMRLALSSITFLRKVDGLSQCHWASHNPLRPEENKRRRKEKFSSFCSTSLLKLRHLISCYTLGLGLTPMPAPSPKFSGFQTWTGIITPAFLDLQLVDGRLWNFIFL